MQRCVFKENSVGMSTLTSILAHLKAKILVCVCMCVCPLELRVILLFWIHILLICDLLTFSGVWSSCYCLMCFVANL